MQRKLVEPVHGGDSAGNISAHAEKTNPSPLVKGWPWKHLCACRENAFVSSTIFSMLETSLRMQRKRKPCRLSCRLKRNISAHAEKTCLQLTVSPLPQKHLCACRENFPSDTLDVLPARNISAHAEKTLDILHYNFRLVETSLRMQRKLY